MTGRRYHWIITLQQPGNARSAATVAGTIDPAPDATRQQLFNEILGQVSKRADMPGSVVLFFALEPNDLAGGAR